MTSTAGLEVGGVEGAFRDYSALYFDPEAGWRLGNQPVRQEDLSSHPLFDDSAWMYDPMAAHILVFSLDEQATLGDFHEAVEGMREAGIEIFITQTVFEPHDSFARHRLDQRTGGYGERALIISPDG